MRLRNIKGSREMIYDSIFTITNETDHKGQWQALFNNNNPVHIEIGMGKGRFIIETAAKNPDINFIGIEKYSSVLLRALEKRSEVELNNLYFIRMDAEKITEVFDKEEVNKIYLNFSDPWPKDRHAKRRLTSKEFFKRYNEILSKDGLVEFKTDNRSLFDFSLEQITSAGWNITNYTYDLHKSLMNINNIMTEYEEKFSSIGNPIHKLIANR